MRRSLLIFCFIFFFLMLVKTTYSENCTDMHGNPYGVWFGNCWNGTDYNSCCIYGVNVILQFMPQTLSDLQQKIFNANVGFGISMNMNLAKSSGHLYDRNVSESISVHMKSISNLPTTTTTTISTQTTSTSTTGSTTTTITQSDSWNGWILFIVLVIIAIVCAAVVFYFKKIRGKETSNDNGNYDMLEAGRWK